MFNSFIIPFRKESVKYSNIFSRYHKNLFGCEYAQTTSSARSALFNILEAMGIGVGDEVIVTGFTCSAVPQPIDYRGATPVYSDINLSHFSVDINSVLKLVNKKTKAIILQHTFGLAAPIEEIQKIANEYNLFLIEDCALALGSKYKGQLLGSFGDASIFSFEISKTISVGWGGIMHINSNLNLIKKIDQSYKKTKIYSKLFASRRSLQAGLSGFLYRPYVSFFLKKVIQLFFKFKIFLPSELKKHHRNRIPKYFFSQPSDYQWKLLLEQYQTLNSINQHSKKNCSTLLNQFKKLNIQEEYFVNILEETALIRLPLLVKNKKKFINYFSSNGFEIGQWFTNVISKTPTDSKNYNYKKGSCKNSEYISNHIINLPLSKRIKKKDLERMINHLNFYYKENKDEFFFSKNIFL